MSKPKNGSGKSKQALQRRMAKKGQVVQLQTEVNNEEDWEKLLTREGLIVVDVYSDWCGPCIGMIGNLKKAKVEYGGESLHLAIAKADEIEVLKRFRNKSEPTWMFIGGGQLVNVSFGANAPKIMRIIENEFRQEQRVMRGETWRRGMPFDELCEEERERVEAADRIKEDQMREYADRAAKELEEKRMKTYTYMSEQLIYETIVVCFPHTIEPDVGCVMTTELEALFRSKSMYVAAQNKVVITPELFDEIFYRGSLEMTDDLMEDLASGPSLALWLKCQVIPGPGQEGSKLPGEVEKMICQEINMVELEEHQELVVPDPKSLAAKYMWTKEMTKPSDEEGEESIVELETNVPGCWTPATYLTKCAACKYLNPARAEKVMQPEEPPPPPRVVIAFDVAKQKEAFDLAAEYAEDVLNIGYFDSCDPDNAVQICANQEQYARLPQSDFNRVVVVVNKVKSDPLLSFAGLGAVYVSPNDEIGQADADKFFPPGVEPVFKLLQAHAPPPPEAEEPQVVEELVEEEDDVGAQTDDDLMAALGLIPASDD